MKKLAPILLWSFRQNMPLMLIVGGYIALAFVLSRIFKFYLRLNIYDQLLLMTVCAVAVVYMATISIKTIWAHRPSRPLKFLLPRLVSIHQVPERVLLALPALLVLPMFFSSFTSLKSAIGIINPYSWDRTFMEFDVAMSGAAPWLLLHAVLHPLLTFGLAFFYNLWVMVMIAVLVMMAFSTDRPLLRSQYLVSFVLAWTVLGTVGAIAFASMGPCFYDLAVPGENNPFEPLMAYLEEVNQNYPVWSLIAQDMLRENYLSGQPRMGTGISAFPSMHMAVAVLNAILGWHLSRTAGWLLTLFAVLIMIGSVHLGWHYAVDGYASALAIPLIWTLSGKIVNFAYAPAPLAHGLEPIASSPSGDVLLSRECDAQREGTEGPRL